MQLSEWQVTVKQWLILCPANDMMRLTRIYLRSQSMSLTALYAYVPLFSRLAYSWRCGGVVKLAYHLLWRTKRVAAHPLTKPKSKRNAVLLRWNGCRSMCEQKNKWWNWMRFFLFRARKGWSEKLAKVAKVTSEKMWTEWKLDYLKRHIQQEK